MNRVNGIYFLMSSFFFCNASSAELTQNIPFTAEQQKAIESISSDYLVKHPEIVSDALEKITNSINTEKINGMKKIAIESQKELLSDKETPYFGDEKAPVSVVVFFDYQCIYCSRFNPIIEETIKNRPQVRFIFKEWPIFSARWPESLQAAKVGLQIFNKKGSKTYLKYHNTLFSLGHNEGKLTTIDISQIENFLNFNYDKSYNPAHALENVKQLASKIGFQGTPAIIVMPSQNAKISDTTIFSGLPDKNIFNNAINTALTARM